MATKQELRHYAQENGVTLQQARDHFRDIAIKNSTKYDLMLRMYPTVGCAEEKCGTLRLQVTDAEIKKIGQPKVTRDELSGALSYAIHECDYSGDKILKHPTYGDTFGALLVQYLTTFESFKMMGFVQNNPAVLMDFYGTAPHRGDNRYEFVLRGSWSQGNGLLDGFEHKRLSIMAPKY